MSYELGRKVRAPIIIRVLDGVRGVRGLRKRRRRLRDPVVPTLPLSQWRESPLLLLGNAPPLSDRSELRK